MGAIRQMRYRPPGAETGPVEVMDFARLRRINTGGTQRADFHVLALARAGRGEVAIDFERSVLTAGRVAWIPPGAVHRWSDIATTEGDVVLFIPGVPVTASTRAYVAAPDLAGVWQVPDPKWRYVVAAADHLAMEVAAGAEERLPELSAILLSALLERLRPSHSSATDVVSTFARFQDLVERGFRAHHDAGYYAHRLGYSARTLSRAVQAATGRTTKRYIADRIALEAKRLLAHDRYSAAQCAENLGFADPSNFSLFFLTMTGQRPGMWQKQHFPEG